MAWIAECFFEHSSQDTMFTDHRRHWPAYCTNGSDTACDRADLNQKRCLPEREKIISLRMIFAAKGSAVAQQNLLRLKNALEVVNLDTRITDRDETPVLH